MALQGAGTTGTALQGEGTGGAALQGDLHATTALALREATGGPHPRATIGTDHPGAAGRMEAAAAGEKNPNHNADGIRPFIMSYKLSSDITFPHSHRAA